MTVLLCEHSFVYPPHALCGDQLSEHSFLLTCALQVDSGGNISITLADFSALLLYEL
uniref:Uncharacterized protein n=1 Tax=Phage sp. ctrsQ3 TaxID=2826752 RepID=A0A8S5MFU6_9VIRU|nr:MAG TPA: hypothetical protein [Phage sp. ctrsQ3]DAG67541.1 MAG TPA: hypothetical protein [Caudoviricetes sp.]